MPMPEDSFELLVRLIAREKNLHQLINVVASYELLLRTARLAYDEQKRSGESNRAMELCGRYQIPFEYFQERLRLIVRLLHLVPQEENYYKILGVDRAADREEIKRSFRQLSRLHHPDVNPDDPKASERFRQILEAYKILSCSELRERYDRCVTPRGEMDELPQEKQARGLLPDGHKLRRLGILVVLLVILSFLIDYQGFIGRRYYRAKYGRVPAVSEESPPPAVSELKVAGTPPKPSLSPTGETKPGNHPKIPAEPPPTPVSTAARQPAAGSKPPASEREKSPVPPKSVPPAKIELQPQKEAGPVAAPSKPPVPSVSPPQPLDPLKESPNPTPEMKQAPAKDFTLPPEPVKPAKPEPVTPAEPAKTATPKPPPSAEPEKTAVAKVAEQPPPTPAQDEKERLQGFLNRYARAFENKNPTVFFALFEPDAVENGEPVASQVPRYRENFQRLENIRYHIRLIGYEASGKGLKVSSSFRLKMKLRGETAIVATGTMQLDLINRGDDFRINSLAYHYEQSGHAED